MESTGFNKVKLHSITLFLIYKYEMRLLGILYKTHMCNELTKKQYIISMILCKSYNINNIYENGKIYKFIDLYIKKYNSNMFNSLIFK